MAEYALNPQKWREILGSFWHYTRYRLFVLMGLIILGGALEGIGILMFAPLIGGITGEESGVITGFLVSALESTGLRPDVPLLLIIIAGIFSLKAGFLFLQGSYAINITNSLSQNLRRDLAKRFFESRYVFISQYQIGTLNNLITIEVENFCGAFTKFVDLLVVLIYVGIYMSGAVALSPEVTVVAVVIGLAGIASVQKVTTRVRELSLQVTESNAGVNSRSVEFLQNLKYYQITGYGRRGLRRLQEQVERLIRDRIKMGELNLGISVLVEPVAVILVLSIFFYHFYFEKGVFEEIVILLMLFYRSFSKLMSFQVEWQRFNACVGGLRAVNDFLNISDEQKNKSIEGDAVPESFAIKLDRFSLRLGDKQVIKDVSIDLPDSAFLGIVGPSGSGKSSLLKSIVGLYQATDGMLSIGGVPQSRISWKRVRESIGYLQQTPTLFDASVRENILLWKEVSEHESTRVDKEVWAALTLAGCETFVKEMGGLQTILGSGGIELSGGQAQRLALARELMKKPKLLILDEPTSSLDKRGEERFVESVAKLKSMMTIIVVSHRPDTLSHCDQVITIVDGELQC